MGLGRWTPLTFLFPTRYIETGSFWAEFDLEGWASAEYEWTQDPWNGFLDFAKRPSETVLHGHGDCEDFALVALSWARAQARSPLGIGFCWKTTRPWPTHVIAYDSEYVYSSGDITRMHLDDWIENSPYAFALRRRVA